jgi:hypothetical protein
MKKSIIVVTICFLCVLSFQAFTTLHQPRFQNLQILPKDISKDALDSVMHHFSVSLGVRCNYCHVSNEETRKMDFAKDDKPEKLVARKMMLMTIDINKNHFQKMVDAMDSGKMVMPADTSAYSYMLKYVTCYTCHRGNTHPENDPPKMNMENNKPQMPPPSPQENNNH